MANLLFRRDLRPRPDFSRIRPAASMSSPDTERLPLPKALLLQSSRTRPPRRGDRTRCGEILLTDPVQTACQLLNSMNIEGDGKPENRLPQARGEPESTRDFREWKSRSVTQITSRATRASKIVPSPGISRFFLVTITGSHRAVGYRGPGVSKATGTTSSNGSEQCNSNDIKGGARRHRPHPGSQRRRVT